MTFIRNVSDVDLFVGGLFEKALPGALLGPTFACIIRDQVLSNMSSVRVFKYCVRLIHVIFMNIAHCAIHKESTNDTKRECKTILPCLSNTL